MPRRPTQEALPGAEHTPIAPLHTTALSYAAKRDERMGLTKEEADLKQALLALMKRYNKQVYRCDGVEICVVREAETVKVTVKPATHDDA